jgi:hypothetical protein
MVNFIAHLTSFLHPETDFFLAFGLNLFQFLFELLVLLVKIL